MTRALILALLLTGCGRSLAPTAPEPAQRLAVASAVTGTSYTVSFSGFGPGYDGVLLDLPIAGTYDHLGEFVDHPLFRGEGSVTYNVWENGSTFNYSYTSAFVLFPGSPYELRGTLLCADAWTYTSGGEGERMDWRGLRRDALAVPRLAGEGALWASGPGDAGAGPRMAGAGHHREDYDGPSGGRGTARSSVAGEAWTAAAGGHRQEGLWDARTLGRSSGSGHPEHWGARGRTAVACTRERRFDTRELIWGGDTLHVTPDDFGWLFGDNLFYERPWETAGVRRGTDERRQQAAAGGVPTLPEMWRSGGGGINDEPVGGLGLRQRATNDLLPPRRPERLLRVGRLQLGPQVRRVDYSRTGVAAPTPGYVHLYVNEVIQTPTSTVLNGIRMVFPGGEQVIVSRAEQSGGCQ